MGAVQRRQARGAGHGLIISAPFRELQLGESIAVNGVCLTVRERLADGFAADVSAETERRTTLGALRPAARVNLERALAVGDRVGGHFVSGHVDGVCHVTAMRRIGNDVLARLRIASEFLPLVAEKGSVSVDGVSLTVNAVTGDTFELMLIPHTLAATNLDQLAVGQRRNFEVDMLARYVRRALHLEPERADTSSARPARR